MIWIPPGFAHGFLVVSSTADLVYKCTSYYEPDDQKSIRWNDPEINIDWPLLSYFLQSLALTSQRIFRIGAAEWALSYE